MHPSVENRFYDLLGRKLSGECQASELEELESILGSHPELQMFYEQIITHPAEVTDSDIDTAYLTHYVKRMYAGRGQQKTKKSFMLSNRFFSMKRPAVKWLMAASAVLMVVLVWQLVRKNRPADQKLTVAATGTQKESRSTMSLPDGSVVRLNAMSKVSYGEGFGRTNRDVYLTGEGYFDVTHNENLPFVVRTDDADIKVLGTKFNVRNYANEHRMEAVLLTGSIELTLREAAQQKIHMKPSDKIIVRKNAAGDRESGPSAGAPKIELTRIKVQDSVITETSWLDEKMAFYDKPFSEIALDLERQFDVHIEFQNKAVSEYKFRGVYDENNAEEILKILQMIKPFQYSLHNNQIIIH